MKKVLIIVFLGLLIYSFSLFNGFVWDDEVSFSSLKNITTAGVYFRPAISAVYSTIYNIFGPRPFFFHFFQLIFHITTAILIFYLFKRFFKETISFFLALIFLVHPVNVEAVSFASAMQEVAFTLTGTIGLYLFVRSENLSIAKVFSLTLLLLISLLMKETAIVFFVLVFCYLIIFKKTKQDVLINYSIFTVIFLMVYFLFRLSGENLYVQGQGLFPIMRVPLTTRLINIPSIIQYYLSMFLYPINLAIAQHWVIKFPNFINFFLPLIIEILLFLAAVAFFIKKKNKIFAFFFLWFLIGLLPHLQIIPLNMTVAERWLYFPMIGVLGMIGVMLSKISDFSLDSRSSSLSNEAKSLRVDDLRGNDLESSPRRRGSSLLISLGIVIILLLSTRSFVRTLDWRNGLSLYSRDIRKDSSFDLQNNMGVELFRIGRYEEAKKYFEISTNLAPYWWVNWNNLGASFEREKNYKKAADYYQKSINNGQYYLAYENLAKTLILQGKNQKKTEKFLRTAIKLFPENQNLLQMNTYFQEKNSHK